MKQNLAHVAVVVRDYDEAIQYYTNTLGFKLIEDTVLSETKRWVMVQPHGAENGCNLLLARAATPEQEKHIGYQLGDVFFYFYIPMIFIETLKTIPPKALNLQFLLMLKIMVLLRYSKICTETCGT